MERTFILVVASHYQQALRVCEQKKLPAPNRSVDGVTVIYAGPKDRPRIQGLIPDRVLIARPILERVNRQALQDVEFLAKHRLQRGSTDAEVEWVET